MFIAIVQKHILGHNFLTKAHSVMILVSRTMFSGLRNQLVPFIYIIGLSVYAVCLSWLAKPRCLLCQCLCHGVIMNDQCTLKILS